MPLIQGKSDKAFKKNLKTEMHAGKPQKQSLAIAFSVQRKNKKKAKAMAEGGEIEPSQKFMNSDEQEKALKEGKPLQDLYNPKHEDDEDAKAMADGGEVEITAEDEKMTTVDDADTDEEMNMLDDHSTMDGDEINAKDEHEVGEDSSDSREMDMLDDHETERKQELSHGFAKGGSVMNPKLAESHKMPDEADEHYSSIADAILAKKRNAKAMADGGEVDLEENAMLHGNQEDQMSYRANGKEMYSESDALDLDEPRDSNEHGQLADDDHDMSMVDKLRRHMKSRR